MKSWCERSLFISVNFYNLLIHFNNFSYQSLAVTRNVVAPNNLLTYFPLFVSAGDFPHISYLYLFLWIFNHAQYTRTNTLIHTHIHTIHAQIHRTYTHTHHYAHTHTHPPTPHPPNTVRGHQMRSGFTGLSAGTSCRIQSEKWPPGRGCTISFRSKNDPFLTQKTPFFGLKPLSRPRPDHPQPPSVPRPVALSTNYTHHHLN